MVELFLALLLQLSIITGTQPNKNTSSTSTLSTTSAATSAGTATSLGTGDSGSGETNYGGTGTWDTRD